MTALRATAASQRPRTVRVARASALVTSSRRLFSTADIKSSKRGLKALSENQLLGKTVFVRVDFNVPLDKKSGKISDDTRIRASLPTIEYLVKRGAKVVLASHLGRPDGKVSEKMRLGQAAVRLSELLKQPVAYTKDSVGAEVKAAVQALQPGGVLMLENVRFYAGEEGNDPEYCKKLVEATQPDVYVNDAFGTAHRAHATTAGIVKYIKGPAVAGFLMEKELKFLLGAIESPKRPFAAVVGGAKVSTKLPVLEQLIAKTDAILLGGGMTFTFLKARGLKVGTSLVEDKSLNLAKEVEAKAKARGVELLLPVDVVVADGFKEDAEFKTVDATAIPDGWMGLDIGPKTIAQWQTALGKSKTILWNGPVGVFEWANFAKGTQTIGRTLVDLTQKGVITVVGGGDSVAALEQMKLADKVSHASTGGGASLELLEGQELPGVAALNDA